MAESVVTVEVLHTEGCGNWTAAREAAQRAAAAVGGPIVLTDTLVTSRAEAVRLRFPGSPTVRVNGVDLQPEVAEGALFGLG